MKYCILLIVMLLTLPPDSVLVAFWNMENFFDPFVDSTRSYNDFTENGTQHWTMSKFYRKRNNLYKTILAFSGGNPIGIMGVCEVENDFVLNALFGLTPLKQYNYRWVHYEGPDRRGIDPAIVYSKDLFRLICSEAIPYQNPDDIDMVSRDILYAKFCDFRSDTLHCFVNHWPSKYRGELATIGARNCAAAIVRQKVDSIIRVVPDAKIIVMGDFNDTPDAPCIVQVLGARHLSETSEEDHLVNLFCKPEELGFKGTLKYQDLWMIFDQIIVSKSLINNDSLYCNSSDARIVYEDFLFQEDATYHGLKLNRTYVGPKYNGGFSDHLPIMLLLRYSHKSP
jgi:hypothetical protein